MPPPFGWPSSNTRRPFNFPGAIESIGPVSEMDSFFGSLARTPISARAVHVRPKIQLQTAARLGGGNLPTVVFGWRRPCALTFGSFWNSFTSFQNVPADVKFSRNDPGARHASFDFSWRLPGLQRWLTLYSSSFVHDNVSPLPRARAGINPGIYLSHFRKFPSSISGPREAIRILQAPPVMEGASSTGKLFITTCTSTMAI